MRELLDQTSGAAYARQMKPGATICAGKLENGCSSQPLVEHALGYLFITEDVSTRVRPSAGESPHQVREMVLRPRQNTEREL